VVDEAVVQQTGTRRAYMEALLWFADAAPPRVPAPAFIGRRHLHARLVHLAQESTMTRSRLLWTVAATLVFVGSLTSGAVMALPLDLSPFGVPRRVVFVPTEGQSNRPQGRIYSSKEKGIALPSVVSETKPTYTPAALQAKIAGDVLLAVVVKADGTVGDVTVSRSLDRKYGLDQAAVNAVEKWKFRPGTLNGQPVDVIFNLTVNFKLN
jgi:TonB family protein